MDASVFRERFKKLKKETGMKYEDVAAKTGIGFETVKYHCRSKAGMPQVDYLEAYSKLFDVDIAYLLGEQDCRRSSKRPNPKLRKLLSLMCIYPELPVIPMVDSDVVTDEGYMYWQGSFGDSLVDKYITTANGIILKGHADTFEVLEMVYTPEEIQHMNNSELEILFNGLPWKSAIVVYIKLPEREN